MSDNNIPAFPVILPEDSSGNTMCRWKDGMALRQWYKGMALRDCGRELREYVHEENYNRIAKACAAIADAMLAEDAEFAARSK